jgi:uncharacterized low-complexity protein
MKSSNNIKNFSMTASTALALCMVSGSAAAADANPFGVNALTQGYQIAMNDAKAAEGSCGGTKAKTKTEEGKCGGTKAITDAKADEGKCGASKAKTEEGKCGATKDKVKKEGKCGEAKCGANKRK